MDVWQWIADHWPLLLDILLGPIGIAVGLIIKHWSEIKAGVMDAWQWIVDHWPLLLAIITGPIGVAVLAIAKNWDSIKAGAQDAIDFVKRIFNDVVSFFTGLPGRVAGIWSALFGGAQNAASSAFHGIADLWNNTVGRLSFTIPDWVPGIGGKGFSMPHLATGGIVTQPTIALIGEAGPEAVIPLSAMHQAPRGPVIGTMNVTVGDGADVDLLLRKVAFATMAGRL
jgi:hypothetical protein